MKILELTEDLNFIQIIVMKSCVYIWMGDNSASLVDLAVSMPTRFDSQPSASNLLSSGVDDSSLDIALKVAKRFNIQCFVSCSVSSQYLIQVQTKLFQILKNEL